MNTPTLIIGAIVLIPIILLMVLRINAALVFLSLCLGDVLVQFVSGDTNSFFTLFSTSHVAHAVSSSSGSAIKLGLLALPVLLTALFMVHTVKGSRLILNVLPSAGVGLLGGLLVVPLLSSGLSHSIISSPIWRQAQRTQDLIVGMSALICLFVLWLQRPKAGGGEEKHGKHH